MELKICGVAGAALQQGEPADQWQHVGAAVVPRSEHNGGCFPFLLSRLHTDPSCHPTPEAHREGDSAKCSSYLAKVPQYKPPLFVLCVVPGELFQCLGWGIHT